MEFTGIGNVSYALGGQFNNIAPGPTGCPGGTMWFPENWLGTSNPAGDCVGYSTTMPSNCGGGLIYMLAKNTDVPSPNGGKLGDGQRKQAFSTDIYVCVPRTAKLPAPWVLKSDPKSDEIPGGGGGVGRRGGGVYTPNLPGGGGGSEAPPEEMSSEPGFFQKNKMALIGGGILFVTVIGGWLYLKKS
jgi:hypothetical protein